jgi:RimJ/RimL family protein N-acetyltransferase
MTWLTESRRNKIYLVILATLAVLGSYGIVNQEQIILWGALGSAIFGTGMAAAYTTKAYGKHAKEE